MRPDSLPAAAAEPPAVLEPIPAGPAAAIERKRAAKAHAASKHGSYSTPVASKKVLTTNDGRSRIHIGDCREIIPSLEECKKKQVDLIFADPPFNWSVPYDQWHDGMPRNDYLDFTYAWLKACADALDDRGSLWVNIPDDTAAEIVVYLKKIGLHMVNWCVWHYRFGQHTKSRFINSKVHALYFAKNDDAAKRIWHPERVLEMSDRASTYGDKRTLNKKDGMPSGMRVPMDVWYGPFLGRIQGNNKERRSRHHNQLPEAYLERVILACSEESSIVMDPFTGSGTTGVVAHELKRRFIGVEFGPGNAKSALARIEAGAVHLNKIIGVSTAIHKKRKALDELADKRSTR